MQNTQQSASTFDLLMQQALAASQKDDSETALHLFNEASKQLPQSGIPHFLIGAEYAQLGRMVEAEAAYANAVLLAPDLSIARYQLGLVQFTSGRASMALVTWQPLLTLPNNDPLGLFVRGFIELAQDKFESSLDFFSKGINANHTNAPLNADIMRVIEKIQTVINNNKQQPISPTMADEIKEESSHFLLESYRQQKPLN
jgi:tetratricopeptide (TPR) repeat protein